MESKGEYVMYKKLVLFGSKEVGKSSLVSFIKTNNFSSSISEKDRGILIQ